MLPLKFFTDPILLSNLHRNLLTRLFQDYQQALSPDAAALLAAPNLNHEEFCAAWAALFNTADAFGPPLRDALEAIETLA